MSGFLRAAPARRQSGVTFIELVISIVVIGIAVAGVLLVMTRTTRSSADPMVTHQAVAIAEAYLDEILAKEFADPVDPETGGTEAGEPDRSWYDDVQDYDGLSDSGARDQNDNAIGGLGQYTVGVSVNGEALGPGGQQVGAADSLRITVTVSHPAASAIVVSGYRTNY